jgi:hypothetical protein
VNLSISTSSPDDALSPSPESVVLAPNHNRIGTRTMRMISEKAVALLLAVAMSGTAFNTFIV